MEVEERIRYFRECKGMSVNKLANTAGISQSFLRDIELGKKRPTVDTLALLCDALGISLKDFFDEGTTSVLEQDECIRMVYKLSTKQRRLLNDFLESLIGE